MEGTTKALFSTVLPSLLLSPPSEPDILAMPTGDFIARLCILALLNAIQSKLITGEKTMIQSKLRSKLICEKAIIRYDLNLKYNNDIIPGANVLKMESSLRML